MLLLGQACQHRGRRGGTPPSATSLLGQRWCFVALGLYLQTLQLQHCRYAKQQRKGGTGVVVCSCFFWNVVLTGGKKREHPTCRHTESLCFWGQNAGEGDPFLFDPSFWELFQSTSSVLFGKEAVPNNFVFFLISGSVKHDAIFPRARSGRIKQMCGLRRRQWVMGNAHEQPNTIGHALHQRVLIWVLLLLCRDEMAGHHVMSDALLSESPGGGVLHRPTSGGTASQEHTTKHPAFRLQIGER